MAVDLVQIKAKGPQLGGHIAQGHDLVVAAVDLQAVVVHDHGQVVQLIVGSGHEGLPDLALLTLTVAQQRKHLGVLALHLGAQRHTHGNRAALTQGAGGGVHTGDLLAVRVALQDAVQLPEVLELIAADKAQLCQNRVVTGGSVALAEHKTVTVRPVRIFGVDTHMVIEYAGHQLHRGQGAAGMTAAGVGGHVDDVPAHLTAHAGQFCFIHGKPPFHVLLT